MPYKKPVKLLDPHFQATYDALTEISDSFCLAKWLQVTLHLQNGHNHSCHHPNTHFIPEYEIAANPAALHNTKYKIERQKEMLHGQRPTECQYCWNVEDLEYDDIPMSSDRILKSADNTWGGPDQIQPLMEKVKRGEFVNPRYVEVSFSNLCNFKCSYCSPVHSSLWASEIRNKGPYELVTNNAHNNLEWLEQEHKLPIHHKEYNPYVEAFWQWWPDLIKDLQTFRITGGEPLLEPNTFKTMEMLLDGNDTLNEFSINSNCCVPDENLDRYIYKMKQLLDNGIIKRHRLFTSCDTHGKQAEYIRHGLDYDKWYSNIDKVLTELPQVRVTIMCTANILSLPKFHLFLEDVLTLKKKHTNDLRGAEALVVDISQLRHPNHQNVAILDPHYASLLDKSAELVKNNYNSKEERDNGNFDKFQGGELLKLRRFKEAILQPVNVNEGINPDLAKADFYAFVNEHDERRNTNFLATFPELKEFYYECETQFRKQIPVRRI